MNILKERLIPETEILMRGDFAKNFSSWSKTKFNHFTGKILKLHYIHLWHITGTVMVL